MNLVWFRNDLRVRDNPALYTACENNQPVVAVAAITPGQWQLQDESRSRTEFWLACLQDLANELKTLNIPLKLILSKDNSHIPEKMVDLAGSLGSKKIYYNREVPVYEQQRDQSVEKRLNRAGIACFPLGNDMVVPPEQLTTKQGTPFKVFTPFARAWRARFLQLMPVPLPAPSRLLETGVSSDEIPKGIVGLPQTGAAWCSDLWPEGAVNGHKRLAAFCAEKLAHYQEKRDYPALAATSSLSPYLSVGAVSVRQCLQAVYYAAPHTDWLQQNWVTELIWREFYRYLLYFNPELNRWKPYKPEVEGRIQWRHSTEDFSAWCRGETGFPLVDAGMRQLLETGWMHNRVRMVCASFLTKLLRIDWRDGARFFMQHLIDGDFASNIGGWQWCASVGADAAPYFRIFNPTAQAKRFDSAAIYIERWLGGTPISGSLRPPIIEYSETRKQSLMLYQERGNGS